MVEITQSILRFTNNKHLLPISFLLCNNDDDRRIEDTVNCYFFMSFLRVRKSIYAYFWITFFFCFIYLKEECFTQDVISNTNKIPLVVYETRYYLIFQYTNEYIRMTKYFRFYFSSREFLTMRILIVQLGRKMNFRSWDCDPWRDVFEFEEFVSQACVTHAPQSLYKLANVAKENCLEKEIQIREARGTNRRLYGT